MQAGVEALEELGVEAASGQVPEGRQDIEPDEVVVALAGGVLEDDDLEPLLHCAAHRDLGLGVLVLVDLALEPSEGLLGLGVGAVGFA